MNNESMENYTLPIVDQFECRFCNHNFKCRLCGSKYRQDELEFCQNNEMDDFSSKPEYPICLDL
jgi:hypothetical protein